MNIFGFLILNFPVKETNPCKFKNSIKRKYLSGGVFELRLASKEMKLLSFAKLREIW